MGTEALAGSALATRRWQEAETRLYAGLVAVPDLLEEALALVGRIADHLRSRADDLPSLCHVSEERDVLLDTIGRSPPEALSFETLVEAACAIRYRELRAEAARAHLRDAVERAGEQGLTWVNLGRPSGGDPSGTMPVYGTGAGGTGAGGHLAVHVPSGLCVVAAVEQDDETGAPVLVARVAAFDAATGDLRPPPEGLGGALRAVTPEDHERNQATLRQQIGSMTTAVSDSE